MEQSVATTNHRRFPLRNILGIGGMGLFALVLALRPGPAAPDADPARRALAEYRKGGWSLLATGRPSPLHWNKVVSMWASPEAVAVYRRNQPLAVRENQGEQLDDDQGYGGYPVGSTVVKENHDPAGGGHDGPTLDSITLMLRLSDERRGDPWRYVQVDRVGRTLIDGRADDATVWKSCAECHANMKVRDFLYTTLLDEVVTTAIDAARDP